MRRTAKPLLTGLGVPESLRWHDGALWFSDMARGTVHRWTQADGLDTVARIPGRASGLGWLPDGRLLAVSMDERRVYRREPDGSLVVHADLDGIASGEANDMLVDRAGRAYVGNFGFDYHAFVRAHPNVQLYAPPGPPTARVACFAADGALLGVSEPLLFPNGCVITADGDFVAAETLGLRLTALSLDEAGAPGEARPWASLVAPVLWRLLNHPGLAGRITRRFAVLLERPAIAQRSTTPIAPDGIALAPGERTIWMADALHPQCVHVARGGKIIERVRTSRRAYSCVIGGADGDILFAATGPSPDPQVAGKLDSGCIEMARL